MNELDALIEHIKQHSQVDDVQFQSSVPFYGGGEMVLLRIYIGNEEKPPDLGVKVRDGVGVLLEHGKS